MVAVASHKPSFRAELRVARIAPRKMRLVADVVRGKNYNAALHVLRAMPQRGAAVGIKLLKSAFANASQRIREERLDIDPENLCVVEARVDGGPTFWGMRPSSMRRPQFIHRRTSHILFVLQERETVGEPAARKPAEEPAADPKAPAAEEKPKAEGAPAEPKPEKKPERKTARSKKAPPKTKRKTKRKEK